MIYSKLHCSADKWKLRAHEAALNCAEPKNKKLQNCTIATYISTYTDCLGRIVPKCALHCNDFEPFFTKLIALKLLVPTNFKTVPPGLATYGIWPGGCNLKINKMTPIESVQHSKPLWDDQRPGFYGKLFYEEPERTEKIPIIVGSSLSTVTAVLHSKGIWARRFHQDILSFRHLKPTEWNLINTNLSRLDTFVS